MPNAFTDKNIASRAGKMGGKHLKTKQWEQLGDFITQEGAKRAMMVLDNMNDEDYLDHYGKLLNYFKPRLQSATLNAKVEAKGEIEIVLKEPEWDK